MVRSIFPSKLLQNNAVFFVGAIVTGALNYVLYPIISRFLTVEEFGEVQVLLSIALLLSIVFNIIRIFVVSVVTNESDDTQNARFILALERVLLLVGVAIGTIFMLFASSIQSSLQLQSAAPLIPLALSYLISFILTTRIGYIHAKQQFLQTSLLQTYQAGSKLFFAVAATMLGFGVGGVLWGLTFSSATLLVIAIQTSRKNGLILPQSSSFIQLEQLKLISEHAKYLLLVAIVASSVALLLSFDSVIVKSAFTPEEAGQYAAIAVVARTIFFVTGSVSAVLLASVKTSQSIAANLKTYKTSMAIVIGLGGACLGFIALFPDVIVSKLIGAEYGQLSNLLVSLSIAIFCVSIINLVLYYHVALKDTAIGWLTIVCTCIVLLVVYANRGTLEALVTSFMVGSIAYALAAVAWSIQWHIRQFHHNDQKTTH